MGAFCCSLRTVCHLCVTVLKCSTLVLRERENYAEKEGYPFVTLREWALVLYVLSVAAWKLCPLSSYCVSLVTFHLDATYCCAMLK